MCRLNTETGLLEPSTATFKPTDLHPIGLVIVNTCAALRLTSFRKFEDKDGVVQIEVSNYTLINLFLRMFGPTHERALCTRLLIFQASSQPPCSPPPMAPPIPRVTTVHSDCPFSVLQYTAVVSGFDGLSGLIGDCAAQN